MPEPSTQKFPPGVATKLNNYVYRLIDPRNGETFYVGRGKNDRVFQHIRADIDGDEISNKLKRIREIHIAGFEVSHVIHRHGMDEKAAIEVEAALIDAYPELTNEIGGENSNDYGVMHSREIIERYRAEVAVFRHKALLIIVNRSATERASLYEATRHAWVINRRNAAKAEVILAVRNGLIIAAFVAERWLQMTLQNFPDLYDAPLRSGFVGSEASPELRRLYVGKQVPLKYRKRGAAAPIRYTWNTGRANRAATR
jgi:hypothetical protein